MRRSFRISLTFPVVLCLTAAAGRADPATERAEKRPAAPQPVKLSMRLSDYPRPPAPDSGWGVHSDPNCSVQPEDPGAFFRMLRNRYGLTWFKVLACGDGALETVRAAAAAGVEPVVRIYVPAPAPFFPRPGRESEEFGRLVRKYVEAGAHYIECGNEPNLACEWAPGEWDKPDRVERICEQWLRASAIIREAGGIPVFYAMSVGGDDGRPCGEWWEDVFRTFQKRGKLREAFDGAAFGTHLGTLNHPVDYPFDPKKNLPHGTPEERIESLRKDHSCYLAVELLQHQMRTYLGQEIPILSTEGGCFPGDHSDENYPEITPEMHRDFLLEIFRRFNPQHPKYWGDSLFAQMCWIWQATGGFANDAWHNNPRDGDLPILPALEKEKRFHRVLGSPTGDRP